MAEVMNGITPDQGTPTGARTQAILGAHIDKLNTTKGTAAYGELKPLDMICITDGVPSTFLIFHLPHWYSEASFGFIF